jgi:hypothetical protein
MLPYFVEQETKFCSDNETKLPISIACLLSIAAVEAKAQHEPH